MRILIATDHFPPFIGGAHRQAHLLAKAMAERGHEVAVVTPWHGGLPAFERDEGFEVHRVRQLRTAFGFLVRGHAQRHHPPFPDPVTVFSLRRLISDFEPELIHAYGWLDAAGARTWVRYVFRPSGASFADSGVIVLLALVVWVAWSACA